MKSIKYFNVGEKMRIVVSIPVHEKPEVINDQIKNIKKYIKKPIIVLHVSRFFYDSYKESEINVDDDVYVNPTHLQTKWGDIYRTHVSNYKYIKNKLEFDYFLLQASNDCFVKKGIENYISKYEAGINYRILRQHDSRWWPCSCANDDIALKKIMNQIGVTRIIASQVEGSFYRKDIFDYIVNILDQFITQEDIENFNFYGREEVYFSTIAQKVVDFSRCGCPTTFSEVHRFDCLIWHIRNMLDFFYNKGGKLLMKRNSMDRIENKINDLLFESRIYRIRERDIKAIRSNNTKYLRHNSFLNDYPGYFRLYENENVYSVKRVPRDIENHIRKYINNLD